MRTSSTALLLTIAFLFAPAFADPPPWAKGKGKGKGHDRTEARDDDRGHRSNRHFADNHQVAVREYYGQSFRGGRCPPGLAKKNNGCMPPGQAKKWRMGKPLPPDVVYYELPQPLIVQLGSPPPGHTYVRVAGDILMLTVGTMLVVDAIQNLGR